MISVVRIQGRGEHGKPHFGSVSSTLYACLIVLLFSACRQAANPHTAHLQQRLDRREASRRFRSTILRTGGDDVWMKAWPYPRDHAGQTSRVGNVIADSGSFERILAAVKSEGAAEGLEVAVATYVTLGGMGIADVKVKRHTREILGWRLREVPRLRRVAIVIDDLGQNFDRTQAFLALDAPLTFSILPDLPASRSTAVGVHRAGRDAMLHLPMEPRPGPHASPGKDDLSVGMSRGEVNRIIEQDLASVPFVAGVNNHMGSRATADPKLMQSVMAVLAERRLFFIDSRTTPYSVALVAARRRGVPAFYRSVFLDDQPSVPYTLGQLRRLASAAARQGEALAIGHPYPTTLIALSQFLPELDREDIALVPAATLVRLPEVARMSPPTHLER